MFERMFNKAYAAHVGGTYNPLSDFDFNDNHMCEYCYGDSTLTWKDSENLSYVKPTGYIMGMVDGMAYSIPIKYCPMCGRKLKNE